LTEPSRFDGELAHLESVAAAVPDTPVMRKDFLVDPVQVLEARKAGASGVLLITTMLDDATLASMVDVAFEHDMFVLLESFDEEDLVRSARLLDRDGQLLIGVNTRNLRTLEVDSDRLRRLGPSLPAARCVAESGLRSAGDAARVAGWGYRMALVGTALMRSDDPAELVRSMKAAGAAACS
jgi:indole-3-glycerol phosphate synthase